MAVVLSLVSALAYGVSDFLGGITAKRATAWQVAVVGQSTAVVLMTIVALIVGGSPSWHDLVMAAAAGVGSGLGCAFLYRGLAGARMGVVAPISAVGTALLPVIVGVTLGDRPHLLATIGIILAFPAIVLISRTKDADDAHRSGVVDGILAGLGFGVLFSFLAQVDDAAGMWHFPLMYVVSTLTVLVTAASLRQVWRPTRAALPALVMGPISVLAVVAFYFGTRHGLLSVVAVISSLYPAATVLLAALLLKERIQPWQAVGLACATAAVTLVALG
ncbi:DMT family transporter [Aeromicrobium phragmitis]|uniref:DMT family transporter n=1 Tax=Aeromicrobium phragmitis TaxID=2478914 RepID=A0A3L8PLH1_9ACTN|nr:DMT family transporter [Aeromicrobium phragmitis]RLV56110.1 DMT family transporter [Aeromicrobium phragmitis]